MEEQVLPYVWTEEEGVATRPILLLLPTGTTTEDELFGICLSYDGELEVACGYDYCWEAGDHLSPEERIAVAEHVIALWKKYIQSQRELIGR